MRWLHLGLQLNSTTRALSACLKSDQVYVMSIELIKVGLLVLVASATIVASQDYSRAKIFKIANKLEAFALGTSGPSSGLTVQELEDAYAEFKTWNDAVVSNIKRSLSLDKLLIDFLLTPMDRYPQLIGTSVPGSGPSTQQLHFIKRLEANYKKFRPAYLGQKLTGSYYSAPKTDTLVCSLWGIRDPKPLSEKMFTDARNELMAYRAKLDEIAEYEDIYSNLDEYTQLINYVNRNEVKELETVIFPLFDSMKSPKNIQQLQDKYVKDMHSKHKYVVQDGKLYVIA